MSLCYWCELFHCVREIQNRQHAPGGPRPFRLFFDSFWSGCDGRCKQQVKSYRLASLTGKGKKISELLVTNVSRFFPSILNTSYGWPSWCQSLCVSISCFFCRSDLWWMWRTKVQVLFACCGVHQNVELIKWSRFCLRSPVTIDQSTFFSALNVKLNQSLLAFRILRAYLPQFVLVATPVVNAMVFWSY